MPCASRGNTHHTVSKHHTDHPRSRRSMASISNNQRGRGTATHCPIRQRYYVPPPAPTAYSHPGTPRALWRTAAPPASLTQTQTGTTDTTARGSASTIHRRWKAQAPNFPRPLLSEQDGARAESCKSSAKTRKRHAHPLRQPPPRKPLPPLRPWHRSWLPSMPTAAPRRWPAQAGLDSCGVHGNSLINAADSVDRPETKTFRIPALLLDWVWPSL
jgi:hypothetical protein